MQVTSNSISSNADVQLSTWFEVFKNFKLGKISLTRKHFYFACFLKTIRLMEMKQAQSEVIGFDGLTLQSNFKALLRMNTADCEVSGVKKKKLEGLAKYHFKNYKE